MYKCVFEKNICPTLKDSVAVLLDEGFDFNVVIIVLTVVAFVVTKLEAKRTLFPETVTFAVNDVFAGTVEKKFFTLIRLEAGVPFGSSTINN
jgi:hypothetical protein|tara:strand:- start:848 stop:1123 length:276 start_codon:yes stop_codon:yes gene_type:complete